MVHRCARESSANNNSNASQPLEIKNYIRYLGILIDSNLSWKFHIDYICQKVSKTIGIIAKLRHFVPRYVLLTLYRSLFLPYISYVICASGHVAETHLHKLLVLQKGALRLMFFADPRTHAVPGLFLETIENSCRVVLAVGANEPFDVRCP